MFLVKCYVGLVYLYDYEEGNVHLMAIFFYFLTIDGSNQQTTYGLILSIAVIFRYRRKMLVFIGMYYFIYLFIVVINYIDATFQFQSRWSRWIRFIRQDRTSL